MKEEKQYNYGMALLRIWMCYEVICVHFLQGGGLEEAYDPCILPFYLTAIQTYKNLAVPIFFILAFVFTDVTKLSGDVKIFVKRITRLLEPHLFWSAFLFGLYFLLDFIRTDKNCYGIRELVLQVLFAGSYNRPQWFQIDLIIITIIFMLVAKVSRKYSQYVFWFVLYFSILFQYNGLNMRIYNISIPDSINPSNLVFMLGRICECISYSAVGVLIYKHKLLKNSISKDKARTVAEFLMTLCLLNLFIKYRPFSHINGFGYQGLDKMAISLCTVILFYYLPLKKIMPNYVLKIIEYVSKHTMGIYFLHIFVGNFLKLIGVEKVVIEGSLFYCLLIFVVSAVISMIMSKLPIKIVRMSVT